MTPPSLLFPGYRPRNVNDTVLYETVQEHWPAFEKLTGEHGSLPKFVRREFDDYLKCGRLEYGFARVQCTGCSFEHLLPFSCKRRGFCPSCLGRRMNDLSLHLVDQVLPEVPLRQWVLTAPFSLRYGLGFDRRASGLFIRTFHRALRRHLQSRAKQALGLGSVTDAKVGAITFVQRFDSALRLNVHLHTLVFDGVFVDGQFHTMQPPSPLQVAEVAAEVAARMTRFLEGDDHDCLQDDEPLLSGLYGAAVQGQDALGPHHGKRTVRLVEAPAGSPTAGSALCAEAAGFVVHAETTVAARDRQRRLALCRYLARPPLAQKRLSKMSDGRLVYRMKRTWADGTSAIVLHPYALLSRLCALVPPPRFHMLRYFGVLAGHANDRKDVVPATAEEDPSGQLCLFTFDVETDTKAPKKKLSRTPWAKLLARIFKVDAETCPRCGSPCRIVAFVTDKDDIAAELTSLPRGPPLDDGTNAAQLPLLA